MNCRTYFETKILPITENVFTYCVNSANREDGLQRRVCALLSLPWVCEHKSASAYKSSGFPSWLCTLAQRLSFCYCEFYCSQWHSSNHFNNTHNHLHLHFHQLIVELWKLSADLTVFAAPEVQADCVSLLANLHRCVCETWRVFVFSKALESLDEVVRAAAVRAFPLLLHHLGSTHHNLISTVLLYAL